MNCCHHSAFYAEFSFNTLANGARQFVVQEALDTTLWLGASYCSWLTPITTVISSSEAGAEMITFLTDPPKCFSASDF